MSNEQGTIKLRIKLVYSFFACSEYNHNRMQDNCADTFQEMKGVRQTVIFVW